MLAMLYLIMHNILWLIATLLLTDLKCTNIEILALPNNKAIESSLGQFATVLRNIRKYGIDRVVWLTRGEPLHLIAKLEVEVPLADRRWCGLSLSRGFRVASAGIFASGVWVHSTSCNRKLLWELHLRLLNTLSPFISTIQNCEH